MAYVSLVRPLLEYSSPVWDPWHIGEIRQIEQIQCRATRFAKNYDSYESSPSEIIEELVWQNLQQRRRILQLVLFFKIVHGDVAIPVGDILTTADLRTRAPHQFKYKHLGANVHSYKHSYFPKTIRDWDTPAGKVGWNLVDIWLFSGCEVDNVVSTLFQHQVSD